MTMKIKIRKGFFETNSSSVHVICISKSKGSVPRKIKLYPGEFSEGLEKYDNTDFKLAYILAYLSETNQFEEIIDLLYRLKTKYGIEFDYSDDSMLFLEEIFTKMENGEKIDISDYSSNFIELQSMYYLGQYSYVKNVVEKILSSNDILERFLFGDSYVFTGSDRSSAFEDIYGSEIVSLENTHDVYVI